MAFKPTRFNYAQEIPHQPEMLNDIHTQGTPPPTQVFLLIIIVITLRLFNNTSDLDRSFCNKKQTNKQKNKTTAATGALFFASSLQNEPP